MPASALRAVFDASLSVEGGIWCLPQRWGRWCQPQRLGRWCQPLRWERNFMRAWALRAVFNTSLSVEGCIWYQLQRWRRYLMPTSTLSAVFDASLSVLSGVWCQYATGIGCDWHCSTHPNSFNKDYARSIYIARRSVRLICSPVSCLHSAIYTKYSFCIYSK